MQGALPSGPALRISLRTVHKRCSKDRRPSYFFPAADYDAVIIASLAMTAAKSTDPAVWNKYVETVANFAGHRVRDVRVLRVTCSKARE